MQLCNRSNKVYKAKQTNIIYKNLTAIHKVYRKKNVHVYQDQVAMRDEQNKMLDSGII